MSTKKKKTNKVRVIDEMPEFKRITRIGVNKAKVEKKKMHTNTKPIIKKEKPKPINKTYAIKIIAGIRHISEYIRIMNNKYDALIKAQIKYSVSNDKKNTRSVEYNTDEVLKYCDRIIDEVNHIKTGCINIKDTINKRI